VCGKRKTLREKLGWGTGIATVDFRSLGQQNEQKLLFNFPFLVASRCQRMGAG